MSPEISTRGSLFGRAEFLIPVVTGQLGREGEKCRPLDHVWQTPFIHSTLFVITIIFCIYRKAFQLFHSCSTYKCVSVRCVFQNYACAFVEKLSVRLRAIIEVIVLYIRYAIHVLTQKTWRLHMHIWWTTKSSSISCSPSLFLLFCFSYWNSTAGGLSFCSR